MKDLLAAIVLMYQMLNDRLADRVRHSYGMYYISRIQAWLPRAYPVRLVKAHHYSLTSAKHKYRRGEKQVTAQTPQRLRTYSQPRLMIAQTTAAEAPVFTVQPAHRAPQWENTDAVLADPAWAAELKQRLAAAHLTLTGRSDSRVPGLQHQQTPYLGRDPHGDGADDSPAQSVHSRQGWGNHHGSGRAAHRGGGVQWPATRLPARNATLLDLVHADDFAFRVPQLRRLPQPAC